MKTYLDCYPCFLRQALDAARMAGADEDVQQTVLDQVLDLLKRLSPQDAATTPPVIGERVHRIVRRETGDADPYRAVKARSTRQAWALYPRLKEIVADAEDPLDAAIRLSIAGNIIDFGPNRAYDLWSAVERVLAQSFAIDDSIAFRQRLTEVDRVLYLGDNAGETVFDRVLIETLDVNVTYAVKGGPILNDATREDALAVGLDQAAEAVVDTGVDAPGVILDRCSEHFRQLYEAAALIVAKGQANYETLSADGDRVFFLLQTKCPVIARDIGAPVGNIILKSGGASDR